MNHEAFASKAADAVGVTPHSDMRLFVEQAVKWALKEAALSAAEPQNEPSVAVEHLITEVHDAIDEYREGMKGDKFGPHEWPTVDGIKTTVAQSLRRSALSAQVQDVAGWQPIETAPKDGTPVMLWTVWVGDEISPDPFSEVQIGYWDHGNDLPKSHDFSRRPEWVVQRIGEPTHWMPTPAAPARKEG
ncbi:hypothetical protein [Agrobacterium sp. OT33]|uniref:hypothetical protein n=1 Tax=Agrobacterium sp. OT33 TaxID=2815338 RepID=UPI001A8C9744|nr:hypothetical protein [Agrobacterium sp. OT33]MBO0125167.1 hypothetical protein [Agrobacterium sp. OT33]